MSEDPATAPESRATAGNAPRGEDGRWIAGGPSPNPGGRRNSVREAQDEASQFSSEAIGTLVDIMRWAMAKPTIGRVREARHAAVAILDRAHGKPAQPISGVPGQPIELGGEEVLGLLKKIAGEE